MGICSLGTDPQALAAQPALSPTTKTPETRTSLGTITKKVWLTAGLGYTQIRGTAKSAKAIPSGTINGLAAIDLIRLNPSTMITSGLGLDYSYGGYQSAEGAISTELSLSVLSGVGSLGIAHSTPRFRVSGNLEFQAGILTSLTLDIKESSLFEVSSYSAQNNLQKYNRLDCVIRAMGQVKPSLWAGVYGGYTLSGDLQAKSVPIEPFRGFQAGINITKNFDWMVLRKDAPPPKPPLPKELEQENDPLKGLAE